MKPEMLMLLPLAIVALVFWLVTRIRYVIDDEYVRVKWLGATVRKIALSDIEFADTECPLWNEHWCNTLFAWNRAVRIRRRSGFCRNFIITPSNREEFLTELRAKLPR